MLKRALLTSFLILVVWVAFDFALHNLILAPYYQQNPALWRPLAQMSIPLVFTVRLLLLGTLVITYICLVRPHTLSTGLLFGVLTGLALGISIGFGTYIHSPIPLGLAWAWFIAAVLKTMLAGLICGLLIKEPGPAA